CISGPRPSAAMISVLVAGGGDMRHMSVSVTGTGWSGRSCTKPGSPDPEQALLGGSDAGYRLHQRHEPARDGFVHRVVGPQQAQAEGRVREQQGLDLALLHGAAKEERDGHIECTGDLL